MKDKIISMNKIKKIAQLARISLTKKEEEKMAIQLSDILEHFKDLSSVNVDNVQKIDYYQLMGNQLRDDIIEETDNDEKEKIKKLFPKREGDYLKVDAVLKS